MRLIQTNPESESKKVDEAREKGMITVKEAKHRVHKRSHKTSRGKEKEKEGEGIYLSVSLLRCADTNVKSHFFTKKDPLSHFL